MYTQWTCPVPVSDSSPFQSPVLPYDVASMLMVTGVSCDERSQQWGWERMEGKRLLPLLLSLHSALRISAGLSSFFASTPHTHPVPVSPFRCYSRFLFPFLCRRVPFFLMIGGSDLAGAVGALQGGGRYFPCTLVSCDLTIVLIVLYSGILQVK